MQSFLTLAHLIYIVCFIGLLDIATNLYYIGNQRSVSSSIVKISFYLCFALLIGIYIILRVDENNGYEFVTSYLLEYSMTIDNLFAFIIIFNKFNLSAKIRNRILDLSIISLVIVRVATIHYGMLVLHNYSFVILLMGLILFYSAVKIMLELKNTNKHILAQQTENKIDKIEKINFYKIITMIVLSDLIFSIDSISVAIGITKNEQIIMLSNILSLLGINSLYIVLDLIIKKTEYTKHVLSIILVFISIKIFIEYFNIAHIHPLTTLALVLFLIVTSLLIPKFKTILRYEFKK